MSDSKTTAYHSILKTVHQWPYASRLKLVQDVLKTLEPPVNHPPRKTLEQALGLLATDGPPPSDAEIARWLDEHRLEKYG